MSKKTPKFTVAPPSDSKKPRVKSSGGNAERPVWKVGQTDFDGPWCPKGMSKGVLVEVVQKLKHFERNTWEEITKGGSHFIDIWRISGDAQKRLQELELDDIDALYSIRLSGTERLWGLRENNVFSLLWWDPEHKVYPVEKRNT